MSYSNTSHSRTKPPPLYEAFAPPAEHNLTTVTLSTQSTPLVHVLYPGQVVNPDNALKTLGGTATVSNVFNTPKRKLELRFRPSDIYCNSANGEGSTTCGLLLRIRRKRKAPEEVPAKPEEPPILIELPDPPADPIDLSLLTEKQRNRYDRTGKLPRALTTATGESFEVIKGAENIEEEEDEDDEKEEEEEEEEEMDPLDLEFPFNFNADDDDEEEDPADTIVTLPNGKFMSRNMLLHQDEILLEDWDRKMKEKELDRSGDRKDRRREPVYLQVPAKINIEPPPTSDLSIEPLGVIHRTYKFRGLCDFQYLPTKKNKRGKQVSIQRKIAPMFADPDHLDPRKSIFACNFKEGQGMKTPTFIVPSVMSRVDKPRPSIEAFLEDSVKTEDDQQDIQQFRSTRSRRIVYSYMHSFRITDNLVKDPLLSKPLVPVNPHKDALADIQKRGLAGEPLERMQEAFATRPIWTKQALEKHLGLDKYTLKYVLPCCAYFALNGPWRSCWIRLAFDPRFHKSAFKYQLLDYRVPGAYRKFIPKDYDAAKVGESSFSFRPGVIPPKSQMFYQFCEVKIPEVEELTAALNIRVEKDRGMDFVPSTGFLDEDMAEFIRYAVSRYVEIKLKELGHIRAVTLPEIRLLPGGIIPPPVGYKKKGPIGRKKVRRMRPGKFQGLPLPSEELNKAMGDGEDSLMDDLTIDPSEITEDESTEDISDEDDPILQQILKITRDERDKVAAQEALDMDNNGAHAS